MLRDLQRDFLAALDDDGLPAMRRPAIARVRGFEVYQNNFLVGTRKALALDFPAVARLVGADGFAALCRDYRREWPSTRGDLQHLGAHFAAFLSARFVAGPLAALGDVARLERAMDECLLGPAAAPADIRQLAALDPDALGALRLALHPAVRLLRSPWPLMAIWQAHRDGTDPASIDFVTADVHDIIVQRKSDGIALRAVDTRRFDLLLAIASGTTLADACAAVFGDDDDAAGHALADAFAWELIGSLSSSIQTDDRRGVDA